MNIIKHLNFRISGQYISQTTQVKYLGLAMNEHLDWDLSYSLIDISSSCKKISCE